MTKKRSLLLQDPKFSWLFWTQFLGAFNDNLLKNALVILIAFKTSSILGIPSAQVIPAAGAIFILPFFLFSATAGQLADRYEKNRLIRIIKMAEIGISLLSALGFIFHRYELLLLALLLMGLHSTFFGPIKYSILPQLMSETELVAANAWIEAGSFLSILFGTILGGVLATQDPGGVLVSLFLFGSALMGYLTGCRIPKTQAQAPEIQIQWNPIPPTLEILQYLRKNRTLYFSVLGISWFWFYGGAFLLLFPSYCKDFLQANETWVTLFLTVFSLGIGLGSFLCARLSHRRLELGLVPMGSIGMSLFGLDLFFAGPSDRSRILFDLLMTSVAGGVFIVPLYTMLQERGEPTHRSRVIAANNILNAIFLVGSSLLLMGMIAAQFSIPAIFLTLAVMNAVVGILIYTLMPEFFLRFISWILAHLMYRLKVTGLEHVPHSGPAVLISNHVSFIDWLIIYGAIPRPVRFVMDFNFAPGWVGHFLTRHPKVIMIATLREDPKKLRGAFQKIAEELRAGELICFFPEGKLSSTGEMNPFRSGIEKIVRETPVPVIPMALQGLWGSIFSREGGKALSKFPKRFRGKVALSIGAPVDPKEANVENLFKIVRELMVH